MLIWGTRGVTTTSARGEFHCPQCESRQSYKLKKIRKFFTLYFIPTIPLGTRAEYVECQRCNGTYPTEVLSYDPAVRNAHLETEVRVVLKRTLAMMIVADQKIMPVEIDTAQEIYQALMDSILSKADIEREIEVARSNPTDLWSYLESIRD